MSILVFIIVLLVLVLVHEFGHFIVAKSFNIRVDEFGFGFPPRIFGIKRKETLYSFNLIPFGGFVKIFGENSEDLLMENNTELSLEEKKRSFSYQKKYKQAAVLFAGVFANFLLAWILLSIGFMSGLPTSVGSEPKGYQLQDVNLVIVSVLDDSPAQQAGLASGDKVLKLKTKKEQIEEINVDSFKNFILNNKTEEIEITYLRTGENLLTTSIRPLISEFGEPMIGVAIDLVGRVKLPPTQALIEGIKLDWFITKSTVQGVYKLIADGIQGQGDVFASVVGPIGLVGIVGHAYEFGFVYLLSFAALISVNLAILNLLPFPALDGGRLLFVLIERIKGSRINPKIANTANTVGFIILIILMLLVTYQDVIKLF